MANVKNTTVVASLKDKFSRAKSVVLADYRGLTHKQAEELHRNVKKVGGEFIVAKNSLLKIAGGYQATGPTGALIAYEDELTPLKELFKTIKTLGLPIVKSGVINGIVYDEADISRIAKLPSKEILQGQAVSRLSGPLYGLTYTLNYNLQKLTYILANIKK